MRLWAPTSSCASTRVIGSTRISTSTILYSNLLGPRVVPGTSEELIVLLVELILD
jgi:hypothetical protein